MADTITGKVWKFVCRIAGKVYQFVLDTVEKIGEALTWVGNCQTSPS